jgi:hypothetical protein
MDAKYLQMNFLPSTTPTELRLRNADVVVVVVVVVVARSFLLCYLNLELR